MSANPKGIIIKMRDGNVRLKVHEVEELKRTCDRDSEHLPVVPGVPEGEESTKHEWRRLALTRIRADELAVVEKHKKQKAELDRKNVIADQRSIAGNKGLRKARDRRSNVAATKGRLVNAQQAQDKYFATSGLSDVEYTLQMLGEVIRTGNLGGEKVPASTRIQVAQDLLARALGKPTTAKPKADGGAKLKGVIDERMAKLTEELAGGDE